MTQNKFNPKNLERLNNPKRLEDIPPDKIIKRLEIEKADIIADIGAGTGFFSIAFYELLNPLSVYACDLSEVMVQWIKENVSPKYPNIIPVKSEENILPLENEIADLGFMINLHHELDKPDLILKELSRILKPGGKFFIVDWKKGAVTGGPPQKIRLLPEVVVNQAENCGFVKVSAFNDLSKHFFVAGEKV
ncbi:MAG: class I SAM-dependent methyltransferase [Desulforegulaceae bacterium]|nr:class I SAM-dependent methyltransferase [Desulforegulaceae bacterium]